MAWDWDKSPVEVLSARRAQICLNGMWQFKPALATDKPPTEGWGCILVPGPWVWHGYPPVSGAILAKGAGYSWRFDDFAKLGRAWYQRQIHIPADWKGRALILELNRVSTDARVLVNGKDVGTVAWPSGTVDITSAAAPGTVATLAILVAVAATEKEAAELLGPAPIDPWTRGANLESRGLTGDVILTSRPAGAHIADVFVQPSTRRKELALDVTLSGLIEPGVVRFKANLLNEKGMVEKNFEQEVRVDPAAGAPLRLTWSWPDPRLWDVKQPNLYTLRLSATGAGLDDEYAQVFGFREFWLEGRRAFLNGTEIRLCSSIPAAASVTSTPATPTST